MAARTAKVITNKEDLEKFYNLKEEDITFSFLVETLCEIKGKNHYNPYDIMEVPPNIYGPDGKKNKNKFTTTIGLWLFNKLFIEKELFDVFHYVNDVVNKKKMGAMIQKITYAVLEDDLDVSVQKNFLQKTQFTMRLVSALSANNTDTVLLSLEKISKEKAKLLKQYEKELKAGDELVMEKIEKQLVAYAKDMLKDDPGYDIYDSGMVSFDNNFKNMYIMKGMVKDPDPRKGFDFITSSYMGGVKKEEYPMFAKSQAAGPYSRGKLTETGGYMEKQFMYAYQHLQLDPPGSDCKTNKYITVTLDNSNISKYMYSYIIEGSKLVELTSKNVDKYKGKTVKFRFSSMCESKTGICSCCAGNLFYRLDMKNVGMLISQIGSILKNKNMKAFHDSQVSTNEMNPMKAFGLE